MIDGGAPRRHLLDLPQHVTFATSVPRLLDALAVIQVGIVVWVLGRQARPALRIVLLATALLTVIATILGSGSAAPAITGACHTGAYLLLLAWFAGSLRQDREPVVTSLARRIRASMPDTVVRYTRQVTIAWCVFFAAQIATSAALLLLAPRPVWLTFVTVLNLPLLAAMTVAEFAVRCSLFRHEPRTGLRRTLTAMRHMGNRL